MKLTFEWLRQTLLAMQSSKWGIFAGCTILYILCLLIIFRAFKRREASLDAQLDVACKTLEQIVREYKISDLELIGLSLKACDIDGDPQKVLDEFKARISEE